MYACVLYVYVGILQIFHLWHFSSLYAWLQSVVTYVCIQMCKWKLQWSMANQRNITCKQTLWILKFCRVWMFYKRPLWECCRWNTYVGACVCVRLHIVRPYAISHLERGTCWPVGTVTLLVLHHHMTRPYGVTALCTVLCNYYTISIMLWCTHWKGYTVYTHSYNTPYVLSVVKYVWCHSKDTTFFIRV